MRLKTSGSDAVARLPAEGGLLALAGGGGGAPVRGRRPCGAGGGGAARGHRPGVVVCLCPWWGGERVSVPPAQ